MCIICVKPQGAKLPSEETLERMFQHNPHGAGFMFAENGKVRILKGFMTYKAFRQALTDEFERKHDSQADAIVMHFRIMTHGGTCPQNTHPFPLTDDLSELRSLHTKCEIGVAHNGIIQIKTRDESVSDTQEFIASVLTPVSKSNPKFYESERIRNGISECINGSRMVFMTGTGDVSMIGSFVQDGGCWYSNDSFKPFDKRWLAWYSKLDDDDDCYVAKGNGKKHGKKKKQSQTDVHKRESVRLPWETHSRLYVRLMPLDAFDTVVSEDGTEYYGMYHAIDWKKRVYFIDPDEMTAMETFDTVEGAVVFDKRKSEYFELI